MKSELVKDHAYRERINFNKSLGIYPNGEDNLYPLLVENLISASPTALQCSELYASFMGGAGFLQDFDDVDLSSGNLFAYTPNDLLMDVVESIAKHQGVWVHINYNALYEAEDYSVLPYDYCRLGKKDDKDYHGKVVVSKSGWGRELKKENLQVFDIYNPRKDVIQTQVEKAGGWENYKGQILFFSLQNSRIYPKSLIDGAYLFADTEYRMGLFYNSTSRRGFVDNKLVRHKPFADTADERNFKSNLKELMGTENANAIMTVEDEWDSDNQEGNIKIEDLKSDTKADRFAHFESSSANYIRKSFRNIPPQLVDYVSGKLGNTSGDDLKTAQAIYNASTARDRDKIERLFAVLFKNYKDDINPSGKWEIKQYKILDDGTTS